MGNFFTHFRIPTVLGLGIIMIGLGAGVYLVSQPQNPLTQATLNTNPENVTISNITDQSATISWITKDPTNGFVRYGVSNTDQTALDDKDKLNPSGKTTEKVDHYVTISKLTPQTTYKLKINSNGTLYDIPNMPSFTTAASSVNKNSLPPLIGTVTYSGLPLSQGFALLNIPGAVTQSAPITELGNFTIPLAKVYTQNKVDIFTITPETTAQLQIIAPSGVASATILLNNLQTPLPPISIGQQNLDFTNRPTPTPTPSAEEVLLKQLDLNEDNIINAADEAILKRNFGKNPQNSNADIDNNGIVDQKDLNILRENFNKLVNP